MGTFSTEVFLASRFEEFNELRGAIKEKFSTSSISRNAKIAVVDLNDGNVSHHPPLVECLSNVRRAELFILLLGETYGALAPNSTKSFTHLEYEEAIRDGSNTRVLVYCIGSNYTKSGVTYSEDQKLAEWQREIDKNHTWLPIAPTESPTSIAEKIYNQTISHYFDLRSESLLQEGLPLNDIPEDIADFITSEEDDVDKLEQRYAQKNGIELTDETENSTDVVALLRHPNKIACREHREEAMAAIELGEYGVAIQHLSRALAHRPLDLASNYWLAKLYLHMGRKDKYRDIIELSERAIHIAFRESTPYRVSICYLMAADASAMANKPEEALRYAQKAVDSTPNYSKSHIGLAKHYLLHHHANKDEALKAIRSAYRIYPSSIREVIPAPEFKSILPSIYEMLRDEKIMQKKHLDKILEAGKTLSALPDNTFTFDRPALGQNLTIKQVQEIGRSYIHQLWGGVSRLVNYANSLKLDSSGTYAIATSRLAQERDAFTNASNSINSDMSKELAQACPSYFSPLKIVNFGRKTNIILGLITVAIFINFQKLLIPMVIGAAALAIIRFISLNQIKTRCKAEISQKRLDRVQSLDQAISTLETEIAQHKTITEQAIQNACQATNMFNKLIVGLPQKILPFKPLSNATIGDCVVVFPKRIENAGKSIQWNSRSTFPWEPDIVEAREANGLAYIEEIKNQTLIVSARKAYQQ